MSKRIITFCNICVAVVVACSTATSHAADAIIGRSHYIEQKVLYSTSSDAAESLIKSHPVVSYQLGSSAGNTIELGRKTDEADAYCRSFLSRFRSGVESTAHQSYHINAEFALMLEPNSGTVANRNPDASFGLTNENFMSAKLKFLIRLKQYTQPSTINMAFGYSPVDRSYTDNRRRTPYMDISTYFDHDNTDWQEVEIPLSIFEGVDTITWYGTPSGSEDIDWSKFFAVALMYPVVGRTENIEVHYKDMRLEYEQETECEAKFNVYTGVRVVEALTEGQSIYGRLDLYNQTDVEQNALLMLAIYENGFMTDIKTKTVTVAPQGNETGTTSSITVPKDCEARLFLWSDYITRTPFADEILVK